MGSSVQKNVLVVYITIYTKNKSTMIMLVLKLFSFLAALFLVEGELSDLPEVDRCTTIIVGELAGSEGPMTTHTGILYFVFYIFLSGALNKNLFSHHYKYDSNLKSFSRLLGLRLSVK